MTDEELEALLEGFAEELRPIVQDQLDQVSEQFATRVDAATELVAAVYSVSNIRELWNRRIPRILTALRGIFRDSAHATARDLDAPLPTVGELEGALAAYGDAVDPLLRTVGDNLAQAAQRTLAEGVNAGDSIDQLKLRLKAAFDDTGSQLGPVRAERIAQTESVRAFNAGTLASAEVVTGPDRPLVKQWITRRDTRVREAHADANGQIQLLADAFDVGGFPMQYPGDPTAPADLTINCRCVLKAAAPTGRTASMAEDVEDLASRMPPQLKRYWLVGEGAAKIRWGTPGSFGRCVRELRDDFPQDPEGLCANLYHEATGKWPGQDGAETEHTGAMVALVPRAEDAARLAALSSEAEDQLHLTLFYLGEAADWDDAARESVLAAASSAAQWSQPVQAHVFGVSLWNPQGDNPCWVWNVGDSRDDGGGPQTLADVQREVTYQLEDRHGECPDMPAQFTPWSPHIAAHYGEASIPDYTDGCGPIVFDRIRVAFAGQNWDFPLVESDPDFEPDGVTIDPSATAPMLATWSTPAGTALAFENQQTGDGRVFAPGALYWDGNGPWPLMANENFDSHDDAALAGAIASMYRDGDRIGGDGLLYLTQPEGCQAAMLLGQGAPVGVSVDLDDVDVEMVDATGDVAVARLLRASVLPTEGGGWHIKGETAPVMTAGASGMVLESRRMSFFVGPDGTVPAAAFEVTAAAGDPDVPGEVLDAQRSGDFLMRITRGRVRGATLVTVPAFAGARVTLDNPELFAAAREVTAAIQSDSDYDRVLRHVRRSKSPVGPARVAQYLKMPITAAKRLLAQAASRGEVVRLTHGLYTDSTTSARADHVMTDDMLATLTASATGDVDLPVADRGTPWDGPGAEARVFEWADGDCDKLRRAFAWQDDSAPCEEHRAHKLGYTDVINGQLTIVPRGVFAAQAALGGARGGVDIPEADRDAVERKLADVRAHVDEETGGDTMDDMQASAWKAMADLPAMPAEWFREPTVEELPPGGAGVNYANGRIFGWVAQADEPHAGYAKRIVVNDLGRIDTTHFLRQRFTLDDGSVVKAGAFTMNAGHHRDGAECETSACQFDDTRTVAGIVTVGMNERGMWFSGAAAPWLSEWDRSVFMATQPSYHMKQGPGGQWQLRAVLAVPVPGHSSPLLASAVVERSQLALTAAATMAEVEEAIEAEQQRQEAEQAPVVGVDVDATLAMVAEIDYDRLADSLVAAMARADQRKAAEAAELEALLIEARSLTTTMVTDTTDDGK